MKKQDIGLTGLFLASRFNAFPWQCWYWETNPKRYVSYHRILAEMHPLQIWEWGFR